MIYYMTIKEDKLLLILPIKTVNKIAIPKMHKITLLIIKMKLKLYKI